MKRSGLFAAAAAVLVVQALLAPAGARTPAPTYRTENVYFHCTEPTKVQNLNLAANNVTPGWNTTAPTASVQSGAGCGSADPTGLAGTAQKNWYDASWEGTFTGNLKKLTLHAHTIYVGAARNSGPFGFTLRVGIDGEEITPANGVLVRATPVKSSTGASELVEVTLIGLNYVDIDPLDGLPADGDGTTERTITITVHSQYADQNPLTAWVWDTTEVPSGITFNPATNIGTVVSI